MDLPPTQDRRTAVARRNRMTSRVAVLGNLVAVVATTATGLLTGVFAHDAQAADARKAQAEADAAAARAAATPVVKLVPRPLRTVVVKVPAPGRKSAGHRTTTVRRTTTTRRTTGTAPRRTTTAKAPTTTSNPPATTTSGTKP